MDPITFSLFPGWGISVKESDVIHWTKSSSLVVDISTALLTTWSADSRLHLLASKDLGEIKAFAKPRKVTSTRDILIVVIQRSARSYSTRSWFRFQSASVEVRKSEETKVHNINIITHWCRQVHCTVILIDVDMGHPVKPFLTLYIFSAK